MYILRCSDGSFYTGVTTDPERRIREHNAGKGGAYTRSRKPVQLLFGEAHPNRGSALRREAELKRMSRSEKEVMGR